MQIDPQRSVTGHNGRREWFVVARRQLEEHRERERRAIARDREDRLLEAVRRLEQNHEVELVANTLYEDWRAGARDRRGRRLHGNNTKPFAPPELPQGTINLFDPDSRVMRTQGTPLRQAYNAQAAVNDRQIMLAAEVTVDAADFGHLGPMLETTLSVLERHGVTSAPGRCSRMPATGTPPRCRPSSSAGPRCSPRLTATCARANARAGRTGFMS